MKTRNGFVSNSSSSSFIVALNSNSDGKVTLQVEVDLSRYGKRIDSADELKHYFEDQYGSIEGYILDQYAKCKKAIDAGKTLLIGSFSDEEGGEETFLRDRGLQGIVDEDEVEIIESEGGY